MEVRKYRLTVSGEVEFDDKDGELEELLLGPYVAGGRRLSHAIQELEESASNMRVSMELIGKKGVKPISV